MVRAAALVVLAAVFSFAVQQTTLRTTVHLVIAPTTVTDRAGHNVEGLTEHDFVLYDNGTRRDVRLDFVFEPISLVIAVQSSEFSAEALNKTRKIGSMIEPLVTGERGDVAVVGFDSQVRVLQQFTSNSGILQNTLDSMQPGDRGGKTVDAVGESIRLLAQRPPQRRRVILLFAETRDRGSQAKLEDVLTEAQRENVTIYPVTYSAQRIAFTSKPGTTPPPSSAGIDFIGIFREIGRLGKTNTAEAFAKYTGAAQLSFTRQKALEQAVARIGEELHSEYLLSFQAPASEEPIYHTIEVRVPDRREVTVRTRPGYWMNLPQMNADQH